MQLCAGCEVEKRVLCARFGGWHVVTRWTEVRVQARDEGSQTRLATRSAEYKNAQRVDGGM